MDLQNLCINIIVSNFERYFSQFSNTEDVILKRRFEFLQRKYSHEIASSLYEECRMRTEYIDFLINKHLKVLNFDWLKDSSWDKIVAKFKEIGPSLQELHFEGDHSGMSLQDLIPHVPNLQKLKYEEYCTDGILKSLAQFCGNILEIDIYSSCCVTNEGLKHLCTKEDGESTGLKLRRLCIDSHFHVDEGIAYLVRHMPSIEILGYTTLIHVLYSMHGNDLCRIGKMQPYNLQKLDFGAVCRDRVTHPDFQKIITTLCPRVKDLRYYLETEDDLKFIRGFRDLQHLHLEKPVRSEVVLSQLLESIGKKLHFLAFEYVSISDVTLANCCPLLKEMVLTRVNLKTDGVRSPLFPNLEKCSLQMYHSESAETVGHLFRISPKLEDVSFACCDFRSSILKAEVLKAVKNPIKKITFFGLIGETFIQDILLTCHSLKSMTVAYSYLKDSVKLELSNMAELLRNRPKVDFIELR